MLLICIIITVTININSNRCVVLNVIWRNKIKGFQKLADFLIFMREEKKATGGRRGAEVGKINRQMRSRNEKS